MIFDLPWFIGVPVIAIEVLFLYGISKHYERQLDEQERKERSQLDKL